MGACLFVLGFWGLAIWENVVHSQCIRLGGSFVKKMSTYF